MSEVTLGGYIARHDRAPAFTGSDGRAYSVALWVEEVPDPPGRQGGALLFIRWNASGTEPDGHLETDWIVRGDDEADVRDRLGALSLYDIKTMLDAAVGAREASA